MAVKSQERAYDELDRLREESREKRKKVKTPRELSATMKRASTAIQKAVKSRRKVVRIQTRRNIKVRMEASDVLSFTSGGKTLYKSFPGASIKNVKKTKNGYEIRFKGT